MADVAPNDELRAELSNLRMTVALLTEKSLAAEVPWYRNVATLISVSALVFSLGTTVVAGWHTQEQDIHNLRTELRGLIQRLVALPKDNVEIFQKYKDDPSVIANLGGPLNMENVILSRQADEILKRLPKDQVSATDYIAVAQALANARIFDAALADFNKALGVASPVLYDELGALRSLGALAMSLGKTGEARAYYQRAADIFGKDEYRGFDQITKSSANVETEIFWAGAERAAGNLDMFQQHLARADQLANDLPKASPSDVLRANIAQLRGAPPLSTAQPNLPNPLPQINAFPNPTLTAPRP
jgi:tetratricopeptide (TPR) repeat protein